MEMFFEKQKETEKQKHPVLWYDTMCIRKSCYGLNTQQ